VQPGERVAPSRFINVGIDLQRGADPAVSEDGLGVTCRDVQVLEKRRYDVPEVVNLDRPEFCCCRRCGGRTGRSCAARRAARSGW
jgi:hypothetical protein